MKNIEFIWNGLKNAVGIIKSIAIITLILIVIAFVFSSTCERRKMNKLHDKVVQLEAENSILQKQVKERGGEIEKLAGINAVYLDSLIKVNKILIALKTDFSHLEADFKAQVKKLTTVPPDSSYAFLQKVYPYSGENKYPFNEPQVKGIHSTYLEREHLEKLNYNLQDQLSHHDQKDIIQHNIIQNQGQQIKQYKENEEDYNTIIDNKDKVIDAQDKTINKQKNRKNIYKTLTIISTTVAMMLLII